jgi:hypothetical protein
MKWGKFFPRRPPREKASGQMFGLDKRRGLRVAAAMPVFIYGRVEGQPYSERTETANVSPQGGLVALSTELQAAQTLLLTNLRTNEDLACRVTRLVKTGKGRTLVGVEFLQPAPNFWSIDFSPRPSR